MKKFILLLPLLLLTSCSPTKCPISSLPQEEKNSYNEGDATLQSAEDANTREFTPDSFK